MINNRPIHALEEKLLQVVLPEYSGSESLSDILKQIKAEQQKKLDDSKGEFAPSLDRLDKDGCSALHIVAFYGNTEYLKELLDAKASIDLPTSDNQDSALIFAACSGHMDCVDLLIKRNAYIDYKNESGSTPIICAASRNADSDCVEFLIEAKADLDIRNVKKNTALIGALLNGYNKSALALIKAGANLDRVSSSYPLVLAINSGSFEIVDALLTRNAPICEPFLLDFFLKQQDQTNPRVIACLEKLKLYRLLESKEPIQLREAKSQKDDIVIIPFLLDIGKSFKELPPSDKINLLENRIYEVCQILGKTKPNATWIIGWREYGIEGVKGFSITDEERKKLKSVMLAVSAQYPNLVIIAGSILTVKKKKVSELDTILSYYDSLDWLEDLEKKYFTPACHQISKHKEAIRSIQKSLKKSDDVSVTSNKAVLFHNGSSQRHGKNAPFEENSGISAPVVYQPGKENNASPIITINTDLTIAVSVCRESDPSIRLISRTIGNRKIPLQFLLSNTIDFYFNDLCAEFGAIHLDKRFDPRVVLSPNYKLSKIHLEVYPIDVTAKVEKLDTRLEPIYPVQFKLIDQVNSMYEEEFSDEFTKKTLLILHSYNLYSHQYESYIQYLKSLKLPGHVLKQLTDILNSGVKQMSFLEKNRLEAYLTTGHEESKSESVRKHLLVSLKEFWDKTCKDYHSILLPLKKYIDLLGNNLLQIILIEAFRAEITKISYQKEYLSQPLYAQKAIKILLAELRNKLDELTQFIEKTHEKTMPAKYLAS